MIVVRHEDVLHKTQLLRLLAALFDNPVLSRGILFKGGTCASMLGFLDRFSVDLDFDLEPGQVEEVLRKEFYIVFKGLDLKIKDESKKALEFFLEYIAPKNFRNTIKVDALNQFYKKNVYKAQFLPEINRYAKCATIETMFSHKLIAPIDRFKKHKSIAGRDIYDIHHFFMNGYKFIPEIIEDRMGKSVKDFLVELEGFIEKHITERQITEDLSPILLPDKFQKLRKVLKTETLMMIRNERGGR